MRERLPKRDRLRLVGFDASRRLGLARLAYDHVWLVASLEYLQILRVPGIIECLHQFRVVFLGGRHKFRLCMTNAIDWMRETLGQGEGSILCPER